MSIHERLDMNIIVEGADNTGKSTLVRELAKHTGMDVKYGEGPEKFDGEIIQRAWRYLKMDNTIFDRHPIISQPIYGKFKPDATQIPPEYARQLYRTEPLMIHCYGIAGKHIRKPYDSQTHVKLIQKYDRHIRDEYRKWSDEHAHMTYRAGDPHDNVIRIVKEILE